MTATDDTRRDHVIELVKKALADRPHIADPDSLTADTPLGAAGVDSLDLIVIFSYFEKHWAIPFDDDVLDPGLFDTFGSLAATLLAQADAHGRELV
uniref:Ata19 protein n=1 Tax=Saccharothrix mutabilis subsp. capreolus TaxID=66854 RepID=Q83W16_STRMP|nr:Ata19 protein [Saccharothrix mutabilis subsp. capreolus]